MATGFALHPATERIIRMKPGKSLAVADFATQDRVSESAWRSRLRTAQLRTGYHYRLRWHNGTLYVECEAA